ncbi:MAG TPA: hypothetical protein VIN09_14585 [Chloroflexota bacterium]
MSQVVSIVGAAMILGAYAGVQMGWLKVEQRLYNLLNLLGSLLLAYVAVLDNRIGFILLEGVWAAISALALLRARTA